MWHKKTLKLLISDLAALAQKALSTEIDASLCAVETWTLDGLSVACRAADATMFRWARLPFWSGRTEEIWKQMW